MSETGGFHLKAAFASVWQSPVKRKILYACCLALLFLALFFSVHAMQENLFKLGIIWGDDVTSWLGYSNRGLRSFTFGSGRPVSMFFIGLGFKWFGTSTDELGWYWSFFFALALVSIYVLLAYASRNPWISFAFLLAALISRLNWYYYIVAWGVMESLALTCACLALVFFVRWHRTRRVSSFVISLVFAALALLSHERFLGTPIVISILGIFLVKGWKRRLAFGSSGFAIALVFFLVKTFGLGKPFWVVTGDTQIALNLGTLLYNFWRVFINCFLLQEPQHWFTGMSTEMVAGAGMAWMVLSAIASILCMSIVIYDLVLTIIEKRWGHAFEYLAIAAFYAILAAGGSVSPVRVEPRWIFPPQIMLFTLYCVGLSSLHLPQKAESKLSPKSEKITLLSTKGFFSAFAVIALVFFSSYVVTNRFHYYIDDWYLESQSYHENIIEPYKRSGKEGLCVLTTSEYKKEVKQITALYPPKEFYLIVDHEGDCPSPEKWADCHFVEWKPGQETAPIVFDDALSIRDTWLEESLAFNLFSKSEYLAFDVQEMGNPTGKINGITIKVNGTVRCHELIEAERQIAIPLRAGKNNFVEILPDFTWCPHDYGPSEDTRNLSFFIKNLGHTNIENIHFNEEWTNPTWSNSIYSTRDTALTLDLPSLSPVGVSKYGASIYVNKSLFLHADLSKKGIKSAIPIAANKATYVEIIPDEVFNPKKQGTGNDDRDLGVLVRVLSEAGHEIPALSNEWTTPDYSIAIYNTKYSSISVRILGDVYPYSQNNGVSIYVNEACVLEEDIPPEGVEYHIDIPLNSPLVFTMISKYSFVPKDIGMGDDERELGLYVADLHGIPA